MIHASNASVPTEVPSTRQRGLRRSRSLTRKSPKPGRFADMLHQSPHSTSTETTAMSSIFSDFTKRSLQVQDLGFSTPKQRRERSRERSTSATRRQRALSLQRRAQSTLWASSPALNFPSPTKRDPLNGTSSVSAESLPARSSVSVDSRQRAPPKRSSSFHMPPPEQRTMWSSMPDLDFDPEALNPDSDDSNSFIGDEKPEEDWWNGESSPVGKKESPKPKGSSSNATSPGPSETKMAGRGSSVTPKSGKTKKKRVSVRASALGGDGGTLPRALQRWTSEHSTDELQNLATMIRRSSSFDDTEESTKGHVIKVRASDMTLHAADPNTDPRVKAAVRRWTSEHSQSDDDLAAMRRAVIGSNPATPTKARPSLRQVKSDDEGEPNRRGRSTSSRNLVKSTRTPVRRCRSHTSRSRSLSKSPSDKAISTKRRSRSRSQRPKAPTDTGGEPKRRAASKSRSRSSSRRRGTRTGEVDCQVCHRALSPRKKSSSKKKKEGPSEARGKVRKSSSPTSSPTGGKVDKRGRRRSRSRSRSRSYICKDCGSKSVGPESRTRKSSKKPSKRESRSLSRRRKATKTDATQSGKSPSPTSATPTKTPASQTPLGSSIFTSNQPPLGSPIFSSNYDPNQFEEATNAGDSHVAVAEVQDVDATLKREAEALGLSADQLQSLRSKLI